MGVAAARGWDDSGADIADLDVAGELAALDAHAGAAGAHALDLQRSGAHLRQIDADGLGSFGGCVVLCQHVEQLLDFLGEFGVRAGVSGLEFFGQQVAAVADFGSFSSTARSTEA